MFSPTTTSSCGWEHEVSRARTMTFASAAGGKARQLVNHARRYEYQVYVFMPRTRVPGGCSSLGWPPVCTRARPFVDSRRIVLCQRLN